MEQDNILDIIKSELSNIGYFYEELSLNQQEHIRKIGREISKRLMSQKSALNQISQNKISISSISESVGISRKTIYNNRVLAEYIKEAEIQYSKNIPTNKSDENMKEQLIISREIINKMVKRDINLENKRIEIDSLQKQIVAYKNEIQNLIERNIELSNELKNVTQLKILK
ncbi:hypothetical protein [Acetobacterium wieringae]|uniref:hypothetical protein n=1 Tax=Acetobacterium wieringae TaxID=52694 RepID=UPI0026EFA075|nr:hypothetical protein [Acetobacterium wieringae]